MLLGTLAFVAVLLTLGMFLSRNSMLGFPCGIMWFLVGAQAYTLSTIPWGDIYFYIFFACSLGMTVFSIFAAFGLREKKDVGTDKDEYIDEEGGGDLAKLDDSPGGMGDDGMSREEVEPSKHTRRLHERAKQRRTNAMNVKKSNAKTNWGAFK